MTRQMDIVPTNIKLLQKQRMVEITFSNDETYRLSCEYLRVYSPSAEVVGHAGKGGQLPVGKEQVNIIGIEPVGQYAVKFVFDDGHDTGIYHWAKLYELAINQTAYWQAYQSSL
jgi:DUF971 family protein